MSEVIRKIVIADFSGSSSSLNKEEALDPLTRNKLLIACQNNKELVERVLPFYHLLREDTFGYPLVIPQGSVYVTQGSDRRDTGTHYTSKNVTTDLHGINYS